MSEENKDKIYQAYYTKSEHIVKYMLRKLNLNGTEKIFEPCAGDGVFIDAIIQEFFRVSIEAFELSKESIQLLSKKYEDFENINFKETDTLFDVDLDLYADMGGIYDAVIANPPYGAWQDYEKRDKLKKKYSGFYVKETYTLFLYRCISVLINEGRLVFIIPDTFLNLHMHKQIRKYLLTNTIIEEIALFPSSFFPSVNFGYANLSIISLKKNANREKCLANKMRIINGFKKVEQLNSFSENNTISEITQSSVLENLDYAFYNNENPRLINCLKNTEQTIKDVCNCVTGFYSGNDKKYLKVLSKDVRNSKNYNVVPLDEVQFECSQDLLDGISSNYSFVPIVKGGNIRYLKQDNWFMSWTKEAVAEFKNNKKARYQNSQYYFLRGIGVPMISSSSITSSLIDSKLFDQSIVGIFPRNDKYLYYLLSFFNSPTCNKIIRTINPSTNNSSNYIKKIPFIEPSEHQLKEITRLTKKIIKDIKDSGNYLLDDENSSHLIIRNIYGF